MPTLTNDMMRSIIMDHYSDPQNKHQPPKEGYEKVAVSLGIAAYDKEIDTYAGDVLIHADHLMYSNKRERKRKNK